MRLCHFGNFEFADYALKSRTGRYAMVESGTPRLETANVLFMDIVGYSKMPMDEQQATIEHLQRTVRDTEAFRAAVHSE